MPPRVIGSWELETAIGAGSFAVVWRAKHVHSGVVAAVKEIHTAKLTGKLQVSLASEVSVLQRTSHRNLVGLLDIVKEEDRLFLVLEFCAGGDLGHFLRRYGPVPEACARHLLQQLADGLQALRSQNLMHRDLKPQNLLLCDGSSTPHLKIADFGFARSLQPQGLAETLCGSPLYMAPEILQFHKYDAKADLWSVGAILFELLTGKPPFNGANHLQLLQNIERGEGGRLPASVAASLSLPCKQLLQQLLRRNPLERISYEEFFTHPFLAAAARPTAAHAPDTPLHTPYPTQPHPPQHHVVLPPAAGLQAVPGGPGSIAAAAGAHGAPAPPRVTYTGPLLGVHEATGISVRTAVMQPPTSPPPVFNAPGQQQQQQQQQQATTGSTTSTTASSSHGHYDASTVGDDGLQYTDIDLGPSPSPSPAPLLPPFRAPEPPPGGLSVIEEVDDYVVISGEPSPTSSTYGVQGMPVTRGASTSGGGAAGGGRGRAAWDALSRVGPALLPPRLVASAASQLRNAAVNQTWAGSLGQLAGAVGRQSSLLPQRPSSSPQQPTSASVPSLQPAATTSSASSSQSQQLTMDSSTTAESAASTQQQQSGVSQPAAATPLPLPSLTHLMKIPENVDLLDLVNRVLHILGQAASKAWDNALQEAELAAAAAAEQAAQAGSQQACQAAGGSGGLAASSAAAGGSQVGSRGSQLVAGGSSASSSSIHASRAEPAAAPGGCSTPAGQQLSEEAAMQAAMEAGSAVLRPAAAQVVAAHLLCGQLLAAALDAVAEVPAAGSPLAGAAPGSSFSPVKVLGAGSGGGARTDPAQLLGSLGRSVLGALSHRSAQARLQLPVDSTLVSGTSHLYQVASLLCHTAGMDELMGHYSSSVQQYAKAADLLLFLLLTACQPHSAASADQQAPAQVPVSPLSSPSWAAHTGAHKVVTARTWAQVLEPLPPSQAAHVHQLYVAIRIRQTVCMSDLNSTVQ